MPSQVVTRTGKGSYNNLGITVNIFGPPSPHMLGFVPRQPSHTPGGRLYALRINKGLTMQALAKISGVSVVTISKIERLGYTASPATIEKLTRALMEMGK